jgi:glucans biosynthesis protein
MANRSQPSAFPVPFSKKRCSVASAVVFVLFATLAPAAAFNLDDVAAKAQELARQPFEDATGQVPEWLLKINYDQWRDIRFRTERALWKDRRGSNFRLQFFHPGLFYDRAVAIHTVEGKKVRPVPFSPSEFDYGRNDFASRVPQDLGYAGLRVHYPLKSKAYFDEVIVFLGASYFRAVGKEHVYGISARGLAIDTVEPAGEEFPRFKEVWLVAPPPNARQLTLYALLNSPSLTGAYHFLVRPGEQTIVEVDARLFMRREVRKLGVAPLTSMFSFGENTIRTTEDFRPEVHDSDGLLLSFARGEWLWRPLDNPATIRVSGFRMSSPKGFGLLQRDRDFDHYQDLETRAELRPSVWVAPRGDWGNGRVELVELPATSDFHDNINAYWIPETPPKAGDALTFAYTLHWYSDDPARPPGGRVVATRRDRGTFEDAHRFVIDFAGKKLESLPAGSGVRGVVTIASGADAGELLDQHAVKNPLTGGWRLTFQVRPKQEPLELRAFLAKDAEALSETWSYAILP